MKFDSSLPLKERILKRRKQKRLRLVFFELIIVSFIISGIAVEIIFSKRNQDEIKSVNSQQQTLALALTTDKTISDTQVPIDLTGKNIHDLKDELESYISGFEGKFGIYYMNLSNKDEFGINDTDEYIAASTIKVPLNLYLYHKIKEGDINYEGSITYLKEDYEEGTGEIRYEDFGKKYSVKELSRLSIVCSDNVAANMLFRLIGKQNLKDYMKELGGIVVSNSENISCPKDMALYMKLTYEFCQNNLIYGKDLMDHFINIEFDDRIPELLPKDIRIAHKTGNQVGYVHDVGIVFADRPYVLSIMSKGDDDKEACEVIATISKKIYDYVKE